MARAKAAAEAEAARAKAAAEAEAARAKEEAEVIRAEVERLRAQAQKQPACCGIS